MNNFEKWKQDLTLEGFLKIAGGIPECDKDCPAAALCNESESEGEDILCEDILKKWGEREAD